MKPGRVPWVVTRSEKLFFKAAPGTVLNRAYVRLDTCISAAGKRSCQSRESSRGGRGERKRLLDIPMQSIAE